MAIEFTQFHELVKISPLSNLPNKIMIIILLRLPVKSICRFKCASKSWKTLLSNLKFVELHLAQVLAGNKDYLLLWHLTTAKEEIYMLEREDNTRESRKQKISTQRKKETPKAPPVPVANGRKEFKGA